MPSILEVAPTPFEVAGMAGISPYGDQRQYKMPDIIEFVTSDRYLNHPQLYPRQATLLKTIFLQDSLYTSYDYDVLTEWVEGFHFPYFVPDETLTTVHYEGDWGINPDIFDRIDYLKDHGHRWFSVVCAVQGRRSGKGLIGAICEAYVLWHYICTGSPQEVYGLDSNRRLSGQVYAGKKAQARDNQWRDIANVILSAPCFEKFISQSLGESLLVMAPYDQVRAREMKVETTMDISSFEIVPKEAMPMAARGAASFSNHFDEMAHMVATGVSRSAEEVWNAAEPSLGQFKQDAFVYCGSSPWTMLGKFHELVRQSLEIDAFTHRAMDPTILTLQLASWDIYQDWEKTKGGQMIAANERQRMIGRHLDGREQPTKIATTYFQELKSAVMEYDAKMRRIERVNPDGFRVEYRAKWATAQDSYFDPVHIDRAFAPWNGLDLEQLSIGNPGIFDYYAHGDPGKTSSNFGFAIAHVVPDPDGSPIPHVVFDRIHAWTPGDFQTIDDSGDLRYEMDYETIGEDIRRWGEAFLFSDLSFDQWNSINFVQSLGRYMREISYKQSMVWERVVDAKLNWATAETCKMALALNRVHMPYHELAELEMKFLRKLPGDKVDHPSAGPVTTKDVYDCYDPKTEVLTEHGWKLIRDVAVGEYVATRSADGRLEYQVPTNHIERPFDGDLLVYEGRQANFAVTPTHRMLVRRNAASAPYSQWLFEEASEMLTAKRRWVATTTLVEERPDGKVEFEEAIKPPLVGVERRFWSDDEDVVLRDGYAAMSMGTLCETLGRSRSQVYNRAKVLGLHRGQIGDRLNDRPDALPVTDRRDFAGFLGIWLAEGLKKTRGYDVRLTQVKPEGVEWIDALFDRLGWPVKRRVYADETMWLIPSGGLREWLKQCVDADGGLHIPDEVFTDWSLGEMRALWEGLCVGDGTRIVGRWVRYYTSYKTLADDVQRLAVHIGYTSKIRKISEAGTPISGMPSYLSTRPMYSVSFETAPETVVVTSEIESVPYQGSVYCLTVPNGILLTRRNDVVMWCGNCISIVIHKTIGGHIASAFGEQFAALRVGVAMPGLDQVSSGVADLGNSRPVTSLAVQDLFNRARDRRGSRPMPGQSPFNRRGR